MRQAKGLVAWERTVAGVSTDAWTRRRERQAGQGTARGAREPAELVASAKGGMIVMRSHLRLLTG